ncbi:MAG: NAD(P)-dependent oxidoreductase [Sphingobium sp.]
MTSERKTGVVLWAGIGRQAIAERLARADVIDLRVVDDIDGLETALPGAAILALPSYHYSGEVARLIDRRGSGLGLLQLLTAGYEQVERHGVPATLTVANASPAMAPPVAEHAIALLLALARNLPAMIGRQREKRWERGDLRALRSLSGAKVAIVGLGAIGREVARRLRGFGAHVIAVSRAAHGDPLADAVIPLDRLDDALALADAVILSLPYTAANHHLIGARALARLRRGALLVNVARGGLVDTDAVVAALESGHLGGFATDVAETEPLPSSSPLWSAPNSLITPHVAAADGDAGLRRLAEFAASNILRHIAGEGAGSIVSLPQPAGAAGGDRP